MNPSSTLYFLLLSTNAVCFSNLISLNLRLRKINVPIKSNPTMFPSSYYYADENISAFPTSEATEYPSVVVESPFESANDNTTTSIPSENSTESPSPSVNASSNLSLPMVPPKVKATPKKSTHDQTETTVTFMASEAKSFDHFGHVVVTDETNIFISTYTWRKSSAVHVEGIDKTSSNSTQWIEESRLPLPGSFPLSEFGAGLAAANGSLIVASPYDSSATRNAGSITVYKKGPVGYKPVQTISPKIPLALYGFSVAAHDELLAISAPGEKSKRSEHSGRVYIYSYNSALKKYVEIANLAPTFFHVGNGFGSAISLSRNVLGISTQTDTTYEAGAGAVYLYDIVRGENHAVPMFVEYLLSAPVVKDLSEPESFTNFGRTLLVSNEYAFVSATDPHDFGTGCVYVYARRLTVVHIDDETSVEDVAWNLVSTLRSPVAFMGYEWDSFGYSLASYNDKLLAVGAAKSDMEIDSSLYGSVFLYRVSFKGTSSEAWTLVSQMSSPNKQAYSNYGVSLTTFGDSLLVGADTANGRVNQSGVVYLHKNLFAVLENAPDLPDTAPTETDNTGTDNVFRAARQNLPFILGFMLPTIIIGSVLIGRHIAKYARRSTDSGDKSTAGSNGSSTRRSRLRGKKMTKLGLISAALAPPPPFSETLHSSPTAVLNAREAPHPFSQAEDDDEHEAKTDLENGSNTADEKNPPAQTHSLWNFYGTARNYSHQQLPTDEERARSPGRALQIDTLVGSDRHPILQSPTPLRTKQHAKWPSFQSAWRAVTKQPVTTATEPAEEQEEQSTTHLQEQGAESIRV